MPANSNRFNRYFLLLLLQFAFGSAVNAQLPGLDDSQLRWLGERVYASECNSRPACLTAWNQGEDFPSLGIGHFIWYPRGSNGPFEETFPDLLRYLLSQGVALPPWLVASIDSGAPWADRDAFYREIDEPKMGQLRRLLMDSRHHQARFIAGRLESNFSELIAAAPAARRAELQRRIADLAASHPPLGLYALIDYVHFKGTGLSAAERYAGEGWGLLQALLAMPATGNASLEGFVEAAGEVLRRRVRNAPPARDEGRWLQGWLNRLQGYLPPAP